MTDPLLEQDEMQVFYSAGTRRRRRPAFLAGGGLVVLALVATVLFLTLGSNAKPAKPLAHDTKPAVSPYALNDDPPPSLAGAYSDNLKTAFLALYAYAQWVYEHPNPKFVASFDQVGSPAYKTDLYNVDYLVAHDAHNPNDPRGYDGDIQFIKITLAPAPIRGFQGSQVTRGGHPALTPGVLTVVCKYLKVNLYGPSGSYLQPGQQAGVEALAYSLEQGTDGQWRLYGATVLHPSGGPMSVESS